MFGQLSLQFRPLAVIAAIGALALASSANATTVNLSLTSSLPATGGSVNGINLNGATVGVIGTPGITLNSGTTSGAVTLTSSGGSIVNGTLAGQYTAPVTAGTSNYLSTGGMPNTITLSFSSLQSYLALDWGSIGVGDYISFYNTASTVAIATFTGQNIISAGGIANSDAFTMFNTSGGQFNLVTIGQTNGPSFEASGFEYSVNNVPEPTSIALASAALLGCFAVRRKA